VRIVDVDGGDAVTWPFDRLVLEVVGDDRDYILLTSRESGGGTPPLQVVARGGDLVRMLAGRRVEANARAVLRSFEPNRRETSSRRLRNILLFGVAVMAAAVGGWFMLTKVAGEVAARKMSVETEVAWGKVFADSFLADRRVLTTGPAVEATRKILDALRENLPETPGYPFTLHVADAAMVNAVALPGGHIVVFTGLIREAGSADEVAGVLAHEIQHIVRRHVVKRIAGSLGWRTVAAVMLGSGNLADAVLGAGELLELSYGREQEREADEGGVRLAGRAGFSPTAMADFFDRLRRREKIDLPEFLSTHPDMEGRIGAIRANASKVVAEKGRKPDIDWEAAKASLP
jgi:predicted Zn-dependent protease